MSFDNRVNSLIEENAKLRDENAKLKQQRES
jgi:regulator of replication initiation timing